MTEYKYILEPYNGMNTRFRCPDCQRKDKTFSRYIDTETGEHLHTSVGRCNRESKCCYHYTPKQYYQDNNISIEITQPKPYKPKAITPQSKSISFIPVEVFKASLKGYEENYLIKFLINLFGVDITNKLISSYFIATSKCWNGATVFWQIDIKSKLRTGKIMLYNPITGKRIKEPFNHINWVHKVVKQPDFKLKQCFFGEHLLTNNTSPVAIVESEKTAVIASVYLPQFIWLAVGSLTNLNADKCSILKGRNVILFPDLNGFDKWSNKAKELSPLATFTVSDLLERKASETEKQQGYDLADYLIKFNYKEFTEPTQPVVQPLVEVKTFEQLQPVNYFSIPEQAKPESWEHNITELEKYFTEIALPTQPVKLSKYNTIKNCSLFIESHFATVKANNGKQTFLPYLNRLKELKKSINYKLKII
jgi:hypothetical protein